MPYIVSEAYIHSVLFVCDIGHCRKEIDVCPVEGGGMRVKSENQPHALGYAPGQTLRSENPEREALPVASDGKR